MRTVFVCLILLGLALAPGCGGEGDTNGQVTLACAASLRRVMPDLLDAYAATGKHPTFIVSYAASGTLRRQVEGGAPIDGVVFASAEHVDMLVREGLVAKRTLREVARNRMVLVSKSKDSALTFRTLADLPAGERIAIGEPETVPAGRYARDALQAVGVWPTLEGRFVFTHDVAGVVAYVRRGEVAVGVAYGTEVVGVPNVHVLDRAEGAWAPRPLVVAAPVRESDGEEAVDALLVFLASKEAATIWQRHGFDLP